MTNAIAENLAWLGFWIFAAVFLYVEHTQYMNGHETTIYTHKTPEEKRIREAIVKKLENEAAAGAKP